MYIIHRYAALLIVDPEDEFFPDEVTKIHTDVSAKGLSLLVLAEWFSPLVMDRSKFTDDNTNLLWTPLTGGCNVPALNDLLRSFGIAFGDKVFSGIAEFSVDDKYTYATGTSIIQFPAGGTLFKFSLSDRTMNTDVPTSNVPVMGITSSREGSGRIAVYGDSGCIDEKGLQPGGACYSLVVALAQFCATGVRNGVLAPSLQRKEDLLKEPLGEGVTLPLRWDPLGQMRKFSNVSHIHGLFYYYLFIYLFFIFIFIFSFIIGPRTCCW